jgi:UDP-glucose 4-epimerase
MKIKITGTKGYIVETLLPHLQKKYPSADVRAISVRDANVDLSGTDILIHVAGLIPGKATNNEEYYRINHGLTVKLAEQAKCIGVKHMIYFSTIAVYGRVPLISVC